MHYVATIINGYNRNAMSFKTEKAAEEWLDANNNNLENTTTIDVYDDNWVKKDGFIYTEGKE